jgi:hypothetical protein
MGGCNNYGGGAGVGRRGALGGGALRHKPVLRALRASAAPKALCMFSTAFAGTQASAALLTVLPKLLRLLFAQGSDRRACRRDCAASACALRVHCPPGSAQAGTATSSQHSA